VDSCKSSCVILAAEEAAKGFTMVCVDASQKENNSLRLNSGFQCSLEQSHQAGIEAADMEPLRGDEEVAGGMIHKPMHERLILCDFAVADLTGANAPTSSTSWGYATGCGR
jgi:hypothetical protein